MFGKIFAKRMERNRGRVARDDVEVIVQQSPEKTIDAIISRMMNAQNNEKQAIENDPDILGKSAENSASDSEDMKSPEHSTLAKAIRLRKQIEIAKDKATLKASEVNESLLKSRSERTEKLPQVPSSDGLMYFLPIDYSKRNPWRRITGFHPSGIEIRSSTYPARSSVKKLRFAQAKKPLNYLYSYFSVEILDCDEISGIRIGISRKDYPSKTPLGQSAGSVGYCSDTGSVYLRGSIEIDSPAFSKGDIIGCGIVYPTHYKRYVDLSTDDNSDGMSDVILSSILNKRSMDFVRNVLNLGEPKEDTSESAGATNDLLSPESEGVECDYYNENFVESRTQVEVYFTWNMEVIGKVLTYVPIGGFYPTIHIFSSSAIKMKVDLNPPSS